MIKSRLAHPLALLSTLFALVALPIERAQPAPFDPEHPYAVKDDGTVAPWLTFDNHLLVLRGLAIDRKPAGFLIELNL